jgi:hypothetical protein
MTDATVVPDYVMVAGMDTVVDVKSVVGPYLRAHEVDGLIDQRASTEGVF